MNKLEQIKDEYLKSLGYDDYDNLINDIDTGKCSFKKLILLNDDICEKYAKECVIESLSEASKNFNIYQCNNLNDLRNSDDKYLPADSGWYFAVDKESITNKSNIKLL